MLVLGLLFGLFFAVASAALYNFNAPPWFAVVIAVALGGLNYLIGPFIIQLFLKIRWVDVSEFPPAVAKFLTDRAAAHRMKLPRLGIIEDGNPNAFTFGHYPGNARIVVTRGILDMCDEDEVKAVVAHEFGHVVHWDFVVMTIASTIVLCLYYIYVLGRSGASRSRRNGGAVLVVAVGAFIAYIIAEYLTLFLSRVREYYADRYSAEATMNPNSLSTALAKIAYGLAKSGGAAGVTVAGDAKAEAAAKQKEQFSPMHGLRAMGIFDPKSAASLALAAAGSYSSAAREYDTDVMVKAMEWDLFNPWAGLYELSSSHPLPAKRIRALSKFATFVGQRQRFDFPAKASESYWDEFFTDLLVMYLPILGILAGLGVGFGLSAHGPEGWMQGKALFLTLGAAMVGLGLGLLIRLAFSYCSRAFPDNTVAGLVSQVKVSAIRCIPATLRGKVIGRGIPGLYWSKDLVVEDDTGFMVMIYNQPLGILNFLFGLLRAEKFIGQTVEVTGWYRRAPRPMLEAYQIRTGDGLVNTCWSWATKRFFAWAALIVGIGLLVAGLLGAH
jgi:Zn-dependent protease with chaperone function